MLRTVVLVIATGCGTLIGIDDDKPLACQSLAVIADSGTTVEVNPAFHSDQAAYRAIVPGGTQTVQVAIACDDPAAAIVANGLAVADGRSPPIALAGASVVVDVTVTAGAADPPSLAYHVTVDELLPP